MDVFSEYSRNDNEPQMRVLRASVERTDSITIVEGPPGCGKTSTIVTNMMIISRLGFRVYLLSH